MEEAIIARLSMSHERFVELCTTRSPTFNRPHWLLAPSLLLSLDTIGQRIRSKAQMDVLDRMTLVYIVPFRLTVSTTFQSSVIVFRYSRSQRQKLASS
jgi:hypothetical protein